jgi:hypothetical protein
MVRHLDRQRILRALSGKRVEILWFSGASFAYISRLVCYIVGPFVEKVILLAGTNNLSSREGEAREGPWHLARKVIAFEKRFRAVCPSTELTLPYVLNRINTDSRICSHILRYNWQLIQLRNKGKFSPKTVVLPIDPLPENCFALDGLHLNPRGGKILTDIFCEHLTKV